MGFEEFDNFPAMGLSCYKENNIPYISEEHYMTTANNGTVFHTHTLSNGLQIVGQPMPDFESVAVSFYVRTGSRDEPDPSIAGVSHFLEHMVFKGTKTLDWQEITLAFNKIGAELNAFTSHEATVYYARVLGEYLDRAVELLSDMMYPRLAESDSETEKTPTTTPLTWPPAFWEMARARASTGTSTRKGSRNLPAPASGLWKAPASCTCKPIQRRKRRPTYSNCCALNWIISWM